MGRLCFTTNPEAPEVQRKAAESNRSILEQTQVSTNLGGMIAGNSTINTTAFEEEQKP